MNGIKPSCVRPVAVFATVLKLWRPVTVAGTPWPRCRPHGQLPRLRVPCPPFHVRCANAATKKKREKQRQQQLRFNERKARERKLKRWNGLAKPAKFKRVLSLVDYWFGKSNLPTDGFIQVALQTGQGWMPLATLQTFPKLQYWCGESILRAALKTGLAAKRYEVSEDGNFMRPIKFGRLFESKLEKLQQHYAQVEEGLEDLRSALANWQNAGETADVEELADALVRFAGPYARLHVRKAAERTLQERIESGDRPELIDLLANKLLDVVFDPEDYEGFRCFELFYRDGLDYSDPGVTAAAKKISDTELFNWANEALDDWFEEWFDDEVWVPVTNHALQLAGTSDPTDEERLDVDCEQHVHAHGLPLESRRSIISRLSYVFHRPPSNYLKELGITLEPREDIREQRLAGMRTALASLPDLPTKELKSIVKTLASVPSRLPTKLDCADNVSAAVCSILSSSAMTSDQITALAVQEALEEYAPPPPRDDFEDEEVDDFEDHEYLGGLAFQPPEFETQEPRKKQALLPCLTFKGTVSVVATTYAQVDRHCQELTEKLRPQRSAGDPPASLGFDVEYCTLEEDLEMQPAVLQLAAPGLVVVIWLDKLPEHGHGILARCPSLMALLSDPEILKVGVGSFADALSLSKWSPPEEEIAGVVDLNKLPPAVLREIGQAIQNPNSDSQHEETLLPSLVEGNVRDNVSLVAWCRLLLGKRLKKAKFKGSKTGKAAKKSHWRAAKMTDNMLRYAVDDAAASLAVWEELLSLLPGSLAASQQWWAQRVY